MDVSAVRTPSPVLKTQVLRDYLEFHLGLAGRLGFSETAATVLRELDAIMSSTNYGLGGACRKVHAQAATLRSPTHVSTKQAAVCRVWAWAYATGRVRGFDFR